MKPNAKKNIINIFTRFRQKWPVSFFIGTFLILFFLFFRLFHLNYLIQHLHPKIIYVTAYLPYVLMRYLGEPLSFTGDMIVAPGFTLQIILDCCGIEPMAVFASAVIAYPSKIYQKIKGIMIAIPVFFVINILRILSLYYIGLHLGMAAMNRMHLDVWQVLFILFSLVSFFLWIRWANPNKRIIPTNA